MLRFVGSGGFVEENVNYVPDFVGYRVVLHVVERLHFSPGDRLGFSKRSYCVNCFADVVRLLELPIPVCCAIGCWGMLAGLRMVRSEVEDKRSHGKFRRHGLG